MPDSSQMDWSDGTDWPTFSEEHAALDPFANGAILPDSSDDQTPDPVTKRRAPISRQKVLRRGKAPSVTPPCLMSDLETAGPEDEADVLRGIENLICFTPGAMILTGLGERPIETLKIGDLVVTRDQGLRPIRWIGSREVSGKGRLAPVRVMANAHDMTRSGLLVSPRHRLLYTGHRAELLFGESEVLIPAKDMVDAKSIVREKHDTITYIHLMFDHHQVIYANGIASESFHAGDLELSAMGEHSREAIFEVFPGLRTAPKRHQETARPSLKRHEARLLLDTRSSHFA